MPLTIPTMDAHVRPEENPMPHSSPNLYSADSVRARVEAALRGERTDRLPFIGRLELWQRGLVRTGKLPAEFTGRSLNEIHRAVGFGRQQFLSPYSTRLRGVEVIVTQEERVIHQEHEPLVERFPDTDQFVPGDRPGLTRTTFKTPVGDLVVEHTLNRQMIDDGVRSYTSKHPILCDDDYAPAIYILERMEIVPQLARLTERRAHFGDFGFVVPSIERIPFQQLLIDYFVTTDFFYALHDAHAQVTTLMALLDAKLEAAIRLLAADDGPYIQIGDNLDGDMTNPRLFRHYCLPVYQRYADLIHAQGKRMGSHTDGNLKALLPLLAESGLDVCESFSPAPLTPVTVADALAVWQPKPVIWGGIPSPLLEERTPVEKLDAYLEELGQVIGERVLILNVVDMVLPNNDIERIRRIARWVGQTA